MALSVSYIKSMDVKYHFLKSFTLKLIIFSFENVYHCPVIGLFTFTQAQL